MDDFSSENNQNRPLTGGFNNLLFISDMHMFYCGIISALCKL